MANYYQNPANNQGNYNRGYNNNNRNQGNQEQRKRSGCKHGIGRTEGKPWVSGWNKSAAGYMKFLAFPYKGQQSKTKEVISRSGKVWENWMARITYPDRHTALMPVLREVHTNRIIFRDINMIANPGAPNGGYWGRMIRKR